MGKIISERLMTPDSDQVSEEFTFTSVPRPPKKSPDEKAGKQRPDPEPGEVVDEKKAG
jgi:hypothetical protein